MLAAITNRALRQPQPPSKACVAGTIANCAKPPMAPARPSAQLRRSGATSLLSAPYTTPKVVPDKPMPMQMPALQMRPAAVSACTMRAIPAA